MSPSLTDDKQHKRRSWRPLVTKEPQARTQTVPHHCLPRPAARHPESWTPGAENGEQPEPSPGCCGAGRRPLATHAECHQGPQEGTPRRPADSKDTSPHGAFTAAREPAAEAAQASPTRKRTREQGARAGRRNAQATGWMRLESHARPRAAGQALQRLLRSRLRSTLKGRREDAEASEWALRDKLHLLSTKPAENKTPLYKDRERTPGLVQTLYV